MVLSNKNVSFCCLVINLIILAECDHKLFTIYSLKLDK